MKITEVIPVAIAVGFAVQQFMQIVADPIVTLPLGFCGRNKGWQHLPTGQFVKYLFLNVTPDDLKKWLMGLLSFLVGLVIVNTVDTLRILHPMGIQTPRGWDAVVTALTIGAGAEGGNSIIKWAAYAKDALGIKAGKA